MTYRGRRIPLLIADHDAGILHLAASVLAPDGFMLFSSRTGGALLRLLENVAPELLVLDAQLPDVDGLTLCRGIRSASDIPIVMMSSVDDPREAAMALDAGADDYVRKPFGADELRARVRAVLRRTNVAGPITEALHAGRLFIDGACQCVRLDGQELELSATEFALLGQLVRHQDRVLSHEELLAAVWGRERADSRQLLRVTMSRLRLKLKRCGCDLIRTLPRVGYRLQAGGQAA